MSKVSSMVQKEMRPQTTTIFSRHHLISDSSFGHSTWKDLRPSTGGGQLVSELDFLIFTELKIGGRETPSRDTFTESVSKPPPDLSWNGN